MFKSLLMSVLFLCTVLSAGDITISDAYVRAVPPNLLNSASFMKITNQSSKAILLQSASSDVAKNVELHEHVMNNGMMKMQQVSHIEIPANSSMTLQPGGYHVMLIGLNKKLKEGDAVTQIKLSFSNGENIELKNIPIKSVTSGMMGMKMKK